MNSGLSFTNLCRKNSNASNNNLNINIYPQNQGSSSNLMVSKRNYLQSDRNKGETNLFGQLAAMLESNRSNNQNNSQFSENNNFSNHKQLSSQKVIPQSCRNGTSGGTTKGMKNGSNQPSNFDSNNNSPFKGNGPMNPVHLDNVATVQSIQSPE